MNSLKKRLEAEKELDHHDIGFLYSLSAKARWIVDKDEGSRLLALQAADILMKRWRSAPQLFQAWGPEGDNANGGRIIIDCLMNLPLLYWATDQTGDRSYADCASIQDHTLVWFQPYQLHQVMVPPAPNRSYIRTNLTFDPSFLEHYLTAFPFLEKFFRKMWKSTLQRPVFYAMNNTPILDLLEELHHSVNDSAANKEEDTGFLMLQLMRLLQKQVSDVQTEDNPIHSRGGPHSNGLPTGWMNITSSPSASKRWLPVCICRLTTFHICSSNMPASHCPNT